MTDRVKQTQEGDGSYQAANDIEVHHHHGISATEVVEVFNGLLEPLRQQFTAMAQVVFDQRTSRLRDEVMQELDIPELMEALADPDYQLTMRDAQEAAARTDVESDFALLTRLLKERAEMRNARSVKPAIRKAIAAVSTVPAESLSALCGYWYLYRYSAYVYYAQLPASLDIMNLEVGRLKAAPYPASSVRWWDELVSAGLVVVDEAHYIDPLTVYIPAVLSRMNSVIVGFEQEISARANLKDFEAIFGKVNAMSVPPGIHLTNAGLALVRAQVRSRLPHLVIPGNLALLNYV